MPHPVYHDIAILKAKFCLNAISKEKLNAKSWMSTLQRQFCSHKKWCENPSSKTRTIVLPRLGIGCCAARALFQFKWNFLTLEVYRVCFFTCQINSYKWSFLYEAPSDHYFSLHSPWGLGFSEMNDAQEKFIKTMMYYVNH